MSRQPYEVMADAMLKLEAPRHAIPVRPTRPAPLAQVEVLLTFHPALQSGGPRNVTIPPGAHHEWLTVDVHGRIATGELSGRPVVEDMHLESGGNDVNELLEPLADEIASYVATL